MDAGSARQALQLTAKALVEMRGVDLCDTFLLNKQKISQYPNLKGNTEKYTFAMYEKLHPTPPLCWEVVK